MGNCGVGFAPAAPDRPVPVDEDLHALLAALDHHPLAIELAAARTRLLTVPELRARSDDPNAILEAFKPGTAPPERSSIIGRANAVREPPQSGPRRGRASIRSGGLY